MNKKKNTLVSQVGARIKVIRLTRGLTQAQVAEVAGCDPQTVQRSETGRYGLSLNRLEAVARGLGVGIVELFTDVKAEIPPSPWSAEDAAASSVWQRIPTERRQMALRLLEQLVKE